MVGKCYHVIHDILLVYFSALSVSYLAIVERIISPTQESFNMKSTFSGEYLCD